MTRRGVDVIKTRRKKTPTQDNLSGKRARFEKRPLILEKEEEKGEEQNKRMVPQGLGQSSAHDMQFSFP